MGGTQGEPQPFLTGSQCLLRLTTFGDVDADPADIAPAGGIGE